MNIPDVIQRHTLSKPYKGEKRFMLCLAKEFQTSARIEIRRARSSQKYYPTTETIDEIVLRIVRKFMDDAGLTWHYFSTSMMND